MTPRPDAIHASGRPGRVPAGPLESEATWKALADLAVPRDAAACLIETVKPHGKPQLFAVTHESAGAAAVLAELRLRYPSSLDDPAGLAPVLRSQTPALFRRAPATVVHPQIVRRLGLRAALVAPLASRDRVLVLVTLLAADAGRWKDGGRAALRGLLARAGLIADPGAPETAAGPRGRTDQVLSMVSHDLASPVGAMLLATEALRRAAPHPPRSPAGRALETLTRAAHQMQRLLEEFGSLAAAESGTLTLDPGPHEVMPLMQAAVAECAPMLTQRVVRVLSPASDLNRVTCDRPAVLRVLVRLILTAAKTSAPGGTVELFAEPHGEAVRLTVRDEGPGLTKEQVAQLLEASSGRLSLYLCRRIIEAHGGHFTVESGPGRGTSVSVVLPAALRQTGEFPAVTAPAEPTLVETDRSAEPALKDRGGRRRPLSRSAGS